MGSILIPELRVEKKDTEQEQGSINMVTWPKAASGWRGVVPREDKIRGVMPVPTVVLNTAAGL